MDSKIIEIKSQGAPRISSATLLYRNEDTMFIELDMQTKYCDVVSSCGDELHIMCSERTPLEEEQAKSRYDMTIIKVHEAHGMAFQGQGGGRYTITLCFIREAIATQEEEPIKTQWFDL